MSKPILNLAEKLSPEQRQQLIDWMSEQTYAEVQELVAAPPPDGFGIEVSISTLSRFYKAHDREIAASRSDKIDHKLGFMFESTDPSGYRLSLADMATLCLQERLYEALSRPLNSIDDLKKLAHICTQVHALKLDQAVIEKSEGDGLNHELKQLLPLLSRKERAHSG
jgi:hypothetical protein